MHVLTIATIACATLTPSVETTVRGDVRARGGSIIATARKLLARVLRVAGPPTILEESPQESAFVVRVSLLRFKNSRTPNVIGGRVHRLTSYYTYRSGAIWCLSGAGLVSGAGAPETVPE